MNIFFYKIKFSKIIQIDENDSLLESIIDGIIKVKQKVEYETRQLVSNKFKLEQSILEKLMNEGCLGQVPEILDGDAPHAQRGCDAQAWGVTEALRVWKLLDRRQR